MAVFALEELESFRSEKSSEYSFLGEKVGLAFSFFRTIFCKGSEPQTVPTLAAVRFVRSLRITFEGSHGAALLEKPENISILDFAQRSLAP